MKISKGVKFSFVAVGCVIIILLVLASFFDLSLSLAVYNPSSIFGILFDVFGQAPCYLMMPLSFSFIFAYNYGKKGKKNIILLILSAFASVCIWVVILKLYLKDEVSFILQVLISLPLNGLLFAFIKCSEEVKEKLLKFAVFAIILIATSVLINQGLKYLWGRYRFRDIYRADNLAQFTPWWQIRGINGNKSFPSGHVTAATTMFCLLYLLELFEAKKNKKITLSIILSIYVACVAYSRIVIGAHYLSDVSVGFLVTFIIFVVCYYLMKEFGEKFLEGLTNEKK